MATVAPTRINQLEPEQRFVLPNIGWDGYEAMLKLVGDRAIRITYSRGDLELMSPSRDHERFKKYLGRFIETVTEEPDIACDTAGSTTWRRKVKDRGLETDDCFYIASLPFIKGKKGNLDLSVNPPPDLAIEVEISRSALDRMEIYAALGVPEVWRFDGETLRFEHLQADGTYASVEQSPSFPFLHLDEIVRWLHLIDEIGNYSQWGRLLRQWVRNELVPRRTEGQENHAT